MPIAAVHSLNTVVARLIRPELRQVVEHGSAALEQCLVEAQTGAEPLEQLWQHLDQLRGAMIMLELAGGRALAETLQQACRQLQGREGRSRKKLAGRLGSGLVALPLYFDHILKGSEEIPLLLLPLINEIRAEAGLSPWPETVFADPAFPAPSVPAAEPSAAAGDALADELPRLRHMFQTGLAGLLHQRYQRLSLRLMWRAASRIADSLGNCPARLQWQYAAVLLEAWLAGRMENTVARQRLLAVLEQQLRRWSQHPANMTTETPDAAWLREALFLIALSGCRSAACHQLLEPFGLGEVGLWTEHKLVKERHRMFGKTPETIESVARELGVEMGQAKRLVQFLATQEVTPKALRALGSRMKKIADTVFVVGLPESSDILLQGILTLKRWHDGESSPDAESINSLADALLFVESRFSDIEGLAPLASVPDRPEQLFLISRRQLLDAKSIVIRECLQELHNTQAVIGIYIENAFDESRLANLDIPLNLVRGGLSMLGLPRPAAIVGCTSRFVAALHGESVAASDLPRQLEALADVLITLEHCLEEYEITRQLDRQALRVAERGLEVLGYPLADANTGDENSNVADGKEAGL